MKKTIRKILIVMAIVTVAVVMMSFASSAATYCGDGKCLTVSEYVAPTCTESGYTLNKCTICGYTSRSAATDPALGHDYKNVEWKYEKVADAENGDYYKKGHKCNRCDKTEYERTSGVPVKYQLVELFNPFVAETYCSDVTYTQLAETYKEDPQLIATRKNAEYGRWFIKRGETLISYIEKELGFTGATVYNDWLASIKKGDTCTRIKTKAFGEYTLSGFTTSVKDSGAFTSADLYDFSGVIGTDVKLYAAFTGNPHVKYNVRFVNADGRPEASTKYFEVFHGTKADDGIYKPVVDAQGNYILDKNNVIQYTNPELYMAENANFYYEFKGWDQDHTKIYGDVTIKATYNAIPKAYDYAIYVWDAKSGTYVDSGVRANDIVFGSPLVYSNLPAGKTIEDVNARAKDRTYVYMWNHKYNLLNSSYTFGETVSSVIRGYQDTRYRNEEGYAPVIITPSYDHTPNLYKTRVVVKFDKNVSFAESSSKEYEMEQYLNGIAIQITDANGQLISSGTANLVPGTDYAEYNCYLRDSTSYTVTAKTVLGKYTGASSVDRSTVYSADAPVNLSVGLTINADYLEGLSCKCIHHNSLFQPLWVRILNLLYRLFNIKYVCCDDMYSTIGDILVYTK